MESFTFCPNPTCEWHQQAPNAAWYHAAGFHATKAFGLVPRFKCLSCGKTFSTQTFSIDYYAKKAIDYDQLLLRHASSESGRALARSLGVSCGTVANRIDRLARQAAEAQAKLRVLADPSEAVCVDGFVSFDVSQFFPSEITISVTAGSRLVLDLSHATMRRSGTMTAAQRRRAGLLYADFEFERGAVTRTFSDILDSLASERLPGPRRPLVLVTDEKREYSNALHAHGLFTRQDGERRVAHLTVNSKLPRSYANPLFASNYVDREIRKDQANHHRETTCFTRNVSNGMERLLCYLVQHNWRKRYLIKARVADARVHGEAAGIEAGLIRAAMASMLRERVFLSRIALPKTLERIWRKDFRTPGKEKSDYLPRYALA